MTGEGEEFEIRPLTDRTFLEDLLRLRWSGGALMLRGKIVHPKDVRSPRNRCQGGCQRARETLLGQLVAAQATDEALARDADHQSAPEWLILI